MQECRLPSNCGLHCQRCARPCTPFAQYLTNHPCRCRRALLLRSRETSPRVLSRVPLIVKDREGLAWPVEPIQVRGGWTWWVPRTPFGGLIQDDSPDGRQEALEDVRRLVESEVLVSMQSEIRHDVLYPDWLDTLRPPTPPR